MWFGLEPTSSIGPSGEPRMKPRRARMRGVRPPPSNRAPPDKGVRCGVRGWRGQPGGPGAPVASQGGGGVVRLQQRPTAAPQDRTSPHACRAVTLSNEKALSRFRACPDPHPPVCGPQWVAHGARRGVHGVGYPPSVGARKGTYANPGVPCAERDGPFLLVMPRRGSRAAAPGGALRAIDSSAWPRSWRTYGPRRLQRRSRA
jgi:hypothetical protein